MLRRLLSTSSGAARAVCLENRSALRVSGPEAGKFLQGIVTNDVLAQQHPMLPVLYAHMLNAKGRTMYDIMIYPGKSQSGEGLDYLVEVERDALNSVRSLLKMYRMRAKVEFSDESEEWRIWTAQGEVSSSNLTDGSYRAGPDPRLHGFHRLAHVSTAEPAIAVDSSVMEDYVEARYRHGLCEGLEELEQGEVLPLEHNLDLLKGVCFKKGCYVGQELTTRTHFTGVVRKRALPIHLVSGNSSADLCREQLTFLRDDGKVKRAGRVRAWFGDRGIAVLPVDLLSTNTRLSVTSNTGNEAAVLVISELSPALAEGIAKSRKDSDTKR